MNKGCTPISAKNRTNQANTRGKINAPRVKKHGAYIHLPFEPSLCHEKSERRNCRSCGQSLEAKARLNVLLLIIIIIIIIILSILFHRMSGLVLSIITHSSLTR